MHTLLSLYESPDVVMTARRWSDIYYKLNTHLTVVQNLGNIAAPDELAVRLDSLDPTSPERLPAAALFDSLGGPQLLHTFGEAVTAWAIGNDAITERSHKVAEQLESEGYNPAFLRWSRNIARGPRDKNTPKSTDMLAQNRIMEEVSHTALQHIDLGASLQASRAVGVSSLSEKRINDYGLIPVQIAERNPCTYGRVYDWENMETVQHSGRIFPIYLDVPVGFVVTYKGVPQMTVGTRANGQDELRVQQLQGIMGERYKRGPEGSQFVGYLGSRGLMPLDWQKLGVHVAAQLAQRMNMRTLSMPSGKSVRKGTWCHLNPQEAKKAYDDTADRLRFKPLEDGSWARSTADILRG